MKYPWIILVAVSSLAWNACSPDVIEESKASASAMHLFKGSLGVTVYSIDGSNWFDTSYTTRDFEFDVKVDPQQSAYPFYEYVTSDMNNNPVNRTATFVNDSAVVQLHSSSGNGASSNFNADILLVLHSTDSLYIDFVSERYEMGMRTRSESKGFIPKVN